MNKEELPKTLYLPGRKRTGHVLDIQLKQEDGSFAIPVWGNKEKLFQWLREGGASLLFELENVELSDIVASEKDANRVLSLFQNSHGIVRKLHFEPDLGNVLAPPDRIIPI